MTTLLDHKTTLKYLAYLGFEGDTRTALKVTKPKRVDRKKGKIQRNVFSCYVFGAPGTGKVKNMYMISIGWMPFLTWMETIDLTFKGICP